MEEKQKKMTVIAKSLIIGVVVIIIAVLGFKFWSDATQYVETDNAQIDGNIFTIRSSVTAYLKKIHFTDNQLIQKGDTLISFDTAVLEAKVLQAKAALANAEAAIKVNANRASASMNNVSASLELSEVNQQEIIAETANYKRVQEEFERVKKLRLIKAITQQQFEVAESQLATAKANLDKAIARKQAALTSVKGLQKTARSEEAQISSSEALVAQKRAELALTEEDLHHAFVIAPCAGIVTKRSVQLGQYITAGQSLCAMIDAQQIWVSANIKETQLKSVHIGQQVEVKVDAFPDLKLSGFVNSFSGATGAKFSLMPPDNASGNFVKIVQRVPIRVSLNPVPSKVTLYPGLSATVKIKAQ